LDQAISVATNGIAARRRGDPASSKIEPRHTAEIMGNRLSAEKDRTCNQPQGIEEANGRAGPEQIPHDHKAATHALNSLYIQSGLSERESEVTSLLLRGYSNKLIARNLDISPETVKVYRKRINKKLGTSSAREVFAHFFSAPWLDTPLPANEDGHSSLETDHGGRNTLWVTRTHAG